VANCKHPSSAHHRHRSAALALAVALGLHATTAHALEPEQIAVLVARESLESHQMADHYCLVRHIPRSHIIDVPADNGKNPASEHYYRTVMVPLIRQALRDKKLDDSVTCLVTTYGLPLSIGAVVPTAMEQEEITALRRELIDGLEEIRTATTAYQAILGMPSTAPAPVATAPASTTHAREPDMPPIPELERHLKAAVDGAGKRINAATGPEREKAMANFLQLHQRVAGVAGVADMLHIAPESPNAAALQQQADAVKQEIAEAQQHYEALAAARDKPDIRRAMIDLRRRFHGLNGAVTELHQQIAYLQGEQSEAAFDNELMMLWIDAYPRTRWQNNPMAVTRWPYRVQIARPPHVMMVSRLDGLTVAAVNQMVDQSLKTEMVGLDGTVYFDARGLHQTDDYALFDADLRAAADYLKDNTDMKVVLDDQPALLRAANCPNAALYCGWYSVHNYQESCQWLPGSVAYHVASFELLSLHDPAETGWCSNLLRRGVCGTLGPVSEPYLFSFPKPSQFFPLLVSGLFTQAEVYYLTVPNTSWRIAFVGDPLYNPFKNKPRLSREKLRAHPLLRNALYEMGLDPVPTTLPTPALAP